MNVNIDHILHNHFCKSIYNLEPHTVIPLFSQNNAIPILFINYYLGCRPPQTCINKAINGNSINMTGTKNDTKTVETSTLYSFLWDGTSVSQTAHISLESPPRWIISFAIAPAGIAIPAPIGKGKQFDLIFPQQYDGT